MKIRYTGLILIICMTICMTICMGCTMRNKTQGRTEAEKAQTGSQTQEQVVNQETEALAEGYRDLYESAKQEGTLDSLELQKEIIAYLGRAGYVAVDVNNQIDMVNAELAEEFCEKAQKKQSTEITIFSVSDQGELIRYDIETCRGKMNVSISTLEWEADEPKSEQYRAYEAYSWKYTEKGYFFIEEYQPLGFDGAPGQKGFRIRPMEETFRELNQRYVMPIGYEKNNMLIMDWNEQDYSNLEFYDLYELMYHMKYNRYAPHDDYGEGMEYEVSKEEFEEVIQTYLPVDDLTIEENTVYDPDRQTYRYRPRGRYDFEWPYEPYPEVVDCEEQGDGTLKLTIEGVWEIRMLDQVIVSELVVRPLDNGSCQYLSNKVLCQDETASPQWYKPRLTEEEWERYYAGSE
ncbi:DUF6070 family protein [Dorea sp. YH-dor226]|uniref:DUF6070 family protein n=1 Tax=Dorea sp. YH-dor226 TaxID=3151119 RepID=UPI0032427E3E